MDGNFERLVRLHVAVLAGLAVWLVGCAVEATEPDVRVRMYVKFQEWVDDRFELQVEGQLLAMEFGVVMATSGVCGLIVDLDLLEARLESVVPESRETEPTIKANEFVSIAMLFKDALTSAALRLNTSDRRELCLQLYYLVEDLGYLRDWTDLESAGGD